MNNSVKSKVASNGGVVPAHLAIKRRNFLIKSATEGAAYFDSLFVDCHYEQLREFARKPTLTYKWNDIVDLVYAGYPGERIAAFAERNDIPHYDEEAFVSGFVSRAREVIAWVDERVPFAHFILKMSDEDLAERIATDTDALQPIATFGNVPR